MTPKQSNESPNAERHLGSRSQVVIKLGDCHDNGIVSALQERPARAEEEAVVGIHGNARRRWRIGGGIVLTGGGILGIGLVEVFRVIGVNAGIMTWF